MHHRIVNERTESVYVKDAINDTKKLRKEMKIMTARTRELEDEFEVMGKEIKSVGKRNTLLSSQVMKKDNLTTELKDDVDKINYSNDAQRRRTGRTMNRITDYYEKSKQRNENNIKEKTIIEGK